MIQGIDISHFNSDIDWTTFSLSDARPEFVFIKATEGLDFMDSQVLNNSNAVKQVGLLRGFYHFFRPQLDPIGQAEWFCKNILDLQAELPPVCDFEVHSPNAISEVQIFMSRVKKLTGRNPILYGSPDFLSVYDNIGVLSDYLLWIADYTKDADPKICSPWINWTFWQYTDQATFPGINRSVDANWFCGTLEQLESL